MRNRPTTLELVVLGILCIAVYIVLPNWLASHPREDRNPAYLLVAQHKGESFVVDHGLTLEDCERAQTEEPTNTTCVEE